MVWRFNPSIWVSLIVFFFSEQPSGQFAPPFRGKNDEVALNVKVIPCKLYTFQLKFIGQNGIPVATINNIKMKPLSEMSGFKLPPILKVLRLQQRATTLTIDLQPDSPIPASCLITYLDAVNSRMQNMGNNPSPGSGFGSSTANQQQQKETPEMIKLKENGCTCYDTTAVNVSSADKTIIKKNKDYLGKYVFENTFHDGKVYFVRQSEIGPKKYYLFWSKKENTWWIADSLTTTSPVFKMDKNAAQTLTCPSNKRPPNMFWKRSGTFTWSKDKTFDVTCLKKKQPSGSQLSITGRPSYSTTPPAIRNQYLSQQGCVCSNTSLVNITSRDSRTLKKHKDELGDYLFTDSQIHGGRPYYLKQISSTNKRYLFFDKAKQTWLVSKTLGGSPLIQLQKKANTNCPENPTAKKWERKNAFGIWSSDSTMRLTCDKVSPSSRPSYVTTRSPYQTTRSPYQTTRSSYQTTRSPYSPITRSSYVTTTPETSNLKSILKRAGCSCWDKTSIKASSTDSRTKSKHADRLGIYEFKGKMHGGKPGYEKKVGPKTYYMYYDSRNKEWQVGETLGGTSVHMKTEDNNTLTCPADKASPGAVKYWKRKNAFGIWGRDKTMKIECFDY